MLKFVIKNDKIDRVSNKESWIYAFYLFINFHGQTTEELPFPSPIPVLHFHLAFLLQQVRPLHAHNLHHPLTSKSSTSGALKDLGYVGLLSLGWIKNSVPSSGDRHSRVNGDSHK